MKAVNQKQLLQSLEDTVELHIQEAIRVFQNLPERELLRPAANGGWSIAACLAHLNSYGDYYLPRIKAAVACQKGLAAGMIIKSSCPGRLSIRMMEPAIDCEKYKPSTTHLPHTDPEAYAVVREFIKQQEELLLYLRSCRGIDLNSISIRAPVFSWVQLKLSDVLQFLIAHNQKHLVQARNNFPGLGGGNAVNLTF